jgi:hypothetical protein
VSLIDGLEYSSSAGFVKIPVSRVDWLICWGWREFWSNDNLFNDNLSRQSVWRYWLKADWQEKEVPVLQQRITISIKSIRLLMPCLRTIHLISMKQHTLKNVNSCWNTKFDFYLETSCDQNSYLYLIALCWFNTIFN